MKLLNVFNVAQSTENYIYIAFSEEDETYKNVFSQIRFLTQGSTPLFDWRACSRANLQSIVSRGVSRDLFTLIGSSINMASCL